MAPRLSGKMAVLVTLALIIIFSVDRTLLVSNSMFSSMMSQEEQSMVESAAFMFSGTSSGLAANAGAPRNYYTDKENFRLAYEQSYGYFDDITNADWMKRQEMHALVFPNHDSPHFTQYSHEHFPSSSKQISKEEKYKILTLSGSWFADNFQVEFTCPLSRRVPTAVSGDGPKWVCDPHRLKNKKDCLVYSVGSNGNVFFEQSVRNEVGEHCEIHTFDVISHNARHGDFAEALKGLSTFHHWGLAPDSDAPDPRYKSLQQTMKELGHEGRSIDLFKIDCEWCEWTTFSDWLTVDMRQILVEVHNAPMPHARDFFYELHDAGYVIFSKEANYLATGSCSEYAFLKLHPDFFVNNTRYSTNPKTKDYYAQIKNARFPFGGSTAEVAA